MNHTNIYIPRESALLRGNGAVGLSLEDGLAAAQQVMAVANRLAPAPGPDVIQLIASLTPLLASLSGSRDTPASAQTMVSVDLVERLTKAIMRPA